MQVSSIKSLTDLAAEGFSDADKLEMAKAQAATIHRQAVDYHFEDGINEFGEEALTGLCLKILNMQVEQLTAKVIHKSIIWSHESLDTKRRISHKGPSGFHIYFAFFESMLNVLLFKDEPIQMVIPLNGDDPHPKTISQLGTLMTFSSNRPATPLVRRVNIHIISAEAPHEYANYLRLFTDKSSLKRRRKERGFNTQHSFSEISYGYPSGIVDTALLTVDLTVKPLHAWLDNITPQLRRNGALPIMRDLLQIAAKAHSFKTPIVLRKLSLETVQVQRSVSKTGQIYWRGRYPKSDYECDAGTNIDEAPWTPTPKLNDVISFLSPEALQQLQLDGRLERIIPLPQHDLWALGVVCACLLWDRSRLTFMDKLAELGNRLHENNMEEKEFVETKDKIISDIEIFWNSAIKEGKIDPMKHLVLMLMHINPHDRMTAQVCLKRIEILANIFDLSKALGSHAFETKIV